MSYTIDVYKRKLEPTKDFIAFSAFVSFFPQLVAGPIERATNLLPQFYISRKFDYFKVVNGIRQILWGLFKKIVVADNCAEYANLIFNNSSDYSGSTLLLGALFFTFQIYGDFSGYSDIAIGTSRLFGFNLKQNFAFPYFSRDISEFWRRWHISLSTWFRDYLYIPIGGSRGLVWVRTRNTFVIFIVSGFWHGANWTFVIWGALNALYFLPLLLTNRNRSHLGTVAQGRYLPSLREFFMMLTTFSLTVFAWIFFRAENVGHALSYIHRMFDYSMFSMPDVENNSDLLLISVIVTIFICLEWFGRNNDYAIENFLVRNMPWVNFTLLSILVFSIYILGKFESGYEFIYFQF